MLAFDMPPPAIIEARPALDLRLHTDGERLATSLPADFLSMPAVLRATVPLDALRGWLTPEWRMLPDGLLADVLYANFPGLPGVLMAGVIKKAWLYTANGQTFRVPGDWNKRDNFIHALGRGGNGGDGYWGTLADRGYGGGGGGGAAWAGIENRTFAFGDRLDMNIAISGGSTWFAGTDVLLAASGTNGKKVETGTSDGGPGGSAGSSVGDYRTSGGNGRTMSTNANGGDGGGAGGPHGNGGDGATGGNGDAGYGGRQGGYGANFQHDGYDGTTGLSGGFNPKGKVNAGSGGAGAGTASDGDWPGGNGGLYGAGAGGGTGGVASGGIGGNRRPTVGGIGARGCLLMINNVSQ